MPAEAAMNTLKYAVLAGLALMLIVWGMVCVIRLAKTNRNFAGAALAVAVLFMPIPDPPPQFEVEESDPGEDDQGDPPEAGAIS
jgi:hypothetical protein